jgi:polyadenylate-binding protein
MSNSAPTPQASAPVNAVAGAPQSNLPSGHASLYVGDLDEDVTEAMVYEKFSPIGQILSIRVCRDMISRKSLGYAYVNFSSTAEAEKAIDQLNFDLLRNRQMRIMWSQRDPSLRKSGVGNLFIKNLDKSIQVRDLYDTFSTFGNILSCKIATDEKGNSKGFGFLHFTSKEAAESAIKRLNGMLLKDKKIFVGPFLPRNQRSNQGSGDSNYNNVFVKNFGEDMDDERLRRMFGEYGDITSHVVMKNEEGVSRGFGFVCFKEPKDATAAVTALHGSDYNGRTLYVGRAMKKNERLEYLRGQLERKKADKTSRYAVGVNLYVKNLDDNMDEESLRKEFSQHGNITSVKVMRDASGRSKGFGFVCFSYPDEATKAVTEMSGKLVGGKPLYVALAQRKEERRIHLQGQYAQRQFIRGPVPQYHSAGLPPNAISQQAAFAAAAAGHGLNMFSLGTYPNNQNPNAMSAAAAQAGFFGFPRNFMAPNMAMQQRPQRWTTPAAPGGPQPQMMRPIGGVSSIPQNMMRQPNPSAVPNQQPRFQQNPSLPNHPSVQMAPGNAIRPPTGQAQQQRVMSGNIAGSINPQGVSVRPGQVQFSMAARNINPPIATGQSRPMTDGQATNGGPQPNVNDVANILHTVPIEEFIQLVQSKTGSDQKQLLGERLYAIVKDWHPQAAGKLTGMLLEIDNRELIAMIVEHHKAGSPDAVTTLRDKCDSALTVLTTAQHSADGSKRDADSKATD